VSEQNLSLAIYCEKLFVDAKLNICNNHIYIKHSYNHDRYTRDSLDIMITVYIHDSKCPYRDSLDIMITLYIHDI